MQGSVRNNEMLIDITLKITPKMTRDAQGKAIGRCVINTYPMNYAEMTGLPCRVVAEK